MHTLLRTTVVVGLVWLPAMTWADDWPTLRRDNHRSAASEETIDVDALQPHWTWQSPQRPRPAWAGPAKWDAYRNMRGLPSMRSYDQTLGVIAVGQHVWIGSSADDSVRCLDARTGEPRWCFTADGPVRIAPSWSEGRVYFGADDGSAYCLASDSGELLWRLNPTAGKRLVLNNNRLISFWPVRTGVLVDGGTAYFAASMLPWKDSYLCAVDAATGHPEGAGRYVQRLDGPTLEGALLASRGRLFVPQGRVPPLVFNRVDGAGLGALKGGGGCFTLLTDSGRLLHGPGGRQTTLFSSDAASRELVASYRGGTMVVIVGRRAYLLTDGSLTAIDRDTQKPVWKFDHAHLSTVVATRDALLLGAADQVLAVAADDGRLLWQAAVQGRAGQLAVAGGRVLVSTDEGAMHCFAPGQPEKPIAVAATDDDPPFAERPDETPLAPIAAVADDALLGRWVFQRPAVADAVVKDQTGRRSATILGDATLQRAGAHEALQLDGRHDGVLIADDHNQAEMPTEAITAEAWVRVDQPLRWGGIVGAIQDNGSFERGWLLGFNDDKFSFAVAAASGPGRLTYLAADKPFEPGKWYHVVGTYDGDTQKVYVNGRPAASSAAQQGPINYPPKAFYQIGAYRDQDEYFRLTGMLYEVCVYGRALTEQQVAERFRAGRDALPAPPETMRLAMGPWAQPVALGQYLFRWHTAEPSPSVLVIDDGQAQRRLADEAAKTTHAMQVDRLRPNRLYEYTIESTVGGRTLLSDTFELDTLFNFSPPSVAAPRATAGLSSSAELPAVLPSLLNSGESSYGTAGQARSGTHAQRILTETKIDRGICLVWGCGDGRLATQLAAGSDLHVIGLDDDAQRVATIRRRLQQAGVYGVRISIVHVDSLTNVPLPGNFANLIVSERLTQHGVCPGSAAEMARLLRPDGGTAWLASFDAEAPTAAELAAWLKPTETTCDVHLDSRRPQARLVRRALSGVGQWTHQYGAADNSAFGGERLGGATSADRFEVQWIGRPGPRYQPDRNGRKPSPLSTGGRLFAQGLQRIVALDAANGAILWSVEIPDFGRFNMPRDCGNWCADRQHIFAAVRDKCWRIDTTTGRLVEAIDVVSPTESDVEFDWGYIGCTESMVLGSATQRGAAFMNFWGGGTAGWYDARSGPATHKVVSDNLFALDKSSGKRRWEYADGLIVNSTISVDKDRVYFVRSTDAAAKQSEVRRQSGDAFWSGARLTALDLATGKPVWEQSLSDFSAETVLYLAALNGRLAMLASGGGHYHVQVFDAATGLQVWKHRFAWSSDNHGGHMSRPALVGDMLYVRPAAFEMATGKRSEQNMPGGGCGTYAATADALIFRAGTVTMWDRHAGKASGWSRLRPGCWLSTIPAAGMVLSPEASGGCSCGSWLETSVGFAPQEE